MPDNEIRYFSMLKKEIVATLQQSVPGISSSIEDWKGQDIVHFQEDLELKAKGRISEKWFYTHIKIETGKLPRIDILNLLSKYAGYIDWADFKIKNKIPDQVEPLPETIQPAPVKANIKKWILTGAIVCAVVFTAYKLFGPHTYHFCFVDADKKTPITNQPVEIVLLQKGESPVHLLCKNGCISVKSRLDKIRFVVKSPYYKIDTITRILGNSLDGEDIHLKTNDYALMIHYFSKAKKTDWERRRKQLDRMFTENAQIYQVYESDNVGMELYNKQEFINKLTMPVQSLKDIEVMETIYTGSRISMLKFRQILNP